MYFPLGSNPFDPWMAYAAALSEMSLAAGEVIFLRSHRMATGAMGPVEALGMVMEKGTAFAVSAERAAAAAAGGGDIPKILTAALAPYGARTRANIRKLRK